MGVVDSAASVSRLQWNEQRGGFLTDMSETGSDVHYTITRCCTRVYETTMSMRFKAVIAGIVALLGATGVAAQAPGTVRLSGGVVSGRVVDAETGVALGSSTVVLEPRDAGAFPAGSGFIPATRTSRTDSAGEYRFGGVPPGDYRLHVQRLGYRSTTVGVELRGTADSRVSVGLSVEPVALERLDVSTVVRPTATPQTYARAAALPEQGSQRVAAERIRQQRHLPSDVRAITHADVVEGITLGETDLFRSLQRLPGVSTRDDYTAELWTRGAPWDQTRIVFDGLPLFNPLHAVGMFSGVNPDAVGAASFHPGVQPAPFGGGAAGVLDLRSRRGEGDEDGGIRGLGELSLASARLALDRQFADGRGAWMIAARRSYLDWLVGGIGKVIDEPDAYLPYAFSDYAARFDYQIDGERSVEVSGLAERDRLSGDLPDILQGNTMSWGNTAARTTWNGPLASGRIRQTIGVSRFNSHVREQTSRFDSVYSAPRAPPSDNSVAVGFLSGEWTRMTATGPAPWSVGYQLERYASDYSGPGLDPFARQAPEDTTFGSSLVVGALWGETRWRPSARVTLDAGLRVEASPALDNTGRVRLTPRVSARFQPNPALSLSAGVGRTYQYTHSLASREAARFGPGLPLPGADLWLISGSDVPAIRSDIATAGAEAWIGNSWLAAVNTYVRWQSGIAVPDPTPGSLLNRPLFADATGQARGIELSARRLAGRWTASAAYSYGVSELEAAGLRFSAPTEQRHTVDVTSMLRVGRSVRLGAAFVAASGAPYARTRPGTIRCDDTVEPTTGRIIEGECEWAEPPRLDAPGNLRGPAYQSLDLLVDWQHAFRGWELGAYLQVRNALNHKNFGPYLGFSEQYCPPSQVSCSTQGGSGESFYETDVFADALPILPVFGFRVSF